MLPGCEGGFWILDAERRSEVVATADGDMEKRNLPIVKLFQVAMNGAISTEDEGGIEVRREFARPICLDTFAERSETSLRHAGFEDGGDVQW